MAQLKNTTIDSTGFIQLASGTTGQRTSPAAGHIRYNTTFNLVEWYDDEYSQWFPASIVTPVATGGTITNITQRGVTYRVHAFTNVGQSSFTVTRGGEVEFLIVAGGGAGGARHGGGGGGGGVLFGTNYVTPGSYNVVVGAGGNGLTIDDRRGENGGDSSALGFTAIGGGAGGVWNGGAYTDVYGANGGCGGGAGGGTPNFGNFERRAGGSGIPGQGHGGGTGIRYLSDSTNAHAGGGGGGAGQPGQDGLNINISQYSGNGGHGIFSDILGTGYFWGGGGGGGPYGSSIRGGLGGQGGGGGGGYRSGTASGPAGLGDTRGINSGGNGGDRFGGNGGANTGGGGGANGGQSNDVGDSPGRGGSGGSGIVVIRYRTSSAIS